MGSGLLHRSIVPVLGKRIYNLPLKTCNSSPQLHSHRIGLRKCGTFDSNSCTDTCAAKNRYNDLGCSPIILKAQSSVRKKLSALGGTSEPYNRHSSWIAEKQACKLDWTVNGTRKWDAPEGSVTFCIDFRSKRIFHTVSRKRHIVDTVAPLEWHQRCHFVICKTAPAGVTQDY